jgi:cytochrome c551/c552
MKVKLLLLAALLTGSLLFANPPASEGKTIFTARCAGCHNVNKQLVGPALAGIDQRRSPEWIVKFVQSSQTLVKSGDKDAVALFEQFNKMPMPDHADLSSDNIKNIVEYIKEEEKAAAAAKSTEPKKAVKIEKPSVFATLTGNTAFLFTFSAAIVLLIASIAFLVRVKQAVSKLKKA